MSSCRAMNAKAAAHLAERFREIAAAAAPPQDGGG